MRSLYIISSLFGWMFWVVWFNPSGPVGFIVLLAIIGSWLFTLHENGKKK